MHSLIKNSEAFRHSVDIHQAGLTSTYKGGNLEENIERLRSYCFRWKDFENSKKAFTLETHQTTDSRVIHGHLISMDDTGGQNGTVTFHFTRLPSPLIPYLPKYWSFSLPVPPGCKWTVCPRANLLVIATLGEDGRCVCPKYSRNPIIVHRKN